MIDDSICWNCGENETTIFDEVLGNFCQECWDVYLDEVALEMYGSLDKLTADPTE